MLVSLKRYTSLEALLPLPPPQPRRLLPTSQGQFLPAPPYCRSCSTTPSCEFRALTYATHAQLRLALGSGGQCISQSTQKNHCSVPQRACRVQARRCLHWWSS